MSHKKTFRNLTSRLVLIALLALLWWWYRRPQLEATPHTKEPAEIPLPPEPSIPSIRQPAADDLTIITGIGPKIAAILQAAGVTTFAQLASMDADRVWQILHDANIRLATPEKWIEQAKNLSAV